MTPDFGVVCLYHALQLKMVRVSSAIVMETMRYFIDRFHATFLEGLQLHFPSNRAFCGVIYYREYLATAVGQ